MRFNDRKQAGILLAEKLSGLKGEGVVVYALPRGGVVTASEIAKHLKAPLSLIITRKIGLPYEPEFAIAAAAENGHFVSAQDVSSVDPKWLREEIDRQRLEAKRRRRAYLTGRPEIDVQGRIAILVDDGVATGLTLRAGIIELKHRKPKKIVVAVPVIPSSTAAVIRKEVDEIVALAIPNDTEFLGAVGSYYRDFPQISDNEVISILNTHET